MNSNNPRIIQVVILDDEPSAIKTLSDDLSEMPNVNVVCATSSADKANKVITEKQPDLLFLDMEMAEMSGLEFLELIEPNVNDNMHIVFYSAHKEYLHDAFRTEAYDFLLKPYKKGEIETIIANVLNHLDSTQMGNLRTSLKRLFHENGRFALQTVSNLLLLRQSDILMFRREKDSRYWQMTLVNRKCHQLPQSYNAEKLLKFSSLFIAVNCGCIINLEYLESIENDKEHTCILYPPFSDIKNIKVSRTFYKKIRSDLEKMM